jgi:2-keto-4-pentenoate hydratase/2-oxohepta-3-ene-1,7-dioic acid hydratase in catechol pathway
MKLLRVGDPGAEKPAVLVGDRLLDVSGKVADFNSAFFAGDGIGWLRDLFAGDEEFPVVSGSPRIGAPIARPGKVVCIGLNYADHAAESGAPIPTEPIMFMKGSDTVIGPNDDVRIPRNSTKTDYEVELAIVIGREARYLATHDEAADVIAGYCVANDVSEREFQLERGGQWDKGKSCETFNPLGPWLVTPDEIPDPQALAMSLDVNGEARQRGNSATMIFGVLEVVRYLSQFLVLEPGDLINTGTPPGVGMGMKPPTYLNPGDVMELTIDGLGTQRQTLIPAP